MKATPREISRFLPILDALAVMAAGWLAHALRFGDLPLTSAYSFALVLGGFLTLVILPATGAYQSWRGRDHSLDGSNALPGLAAVFITLMLIATLTKTTAEFSRLWMGYWALLAAGLAFLGRAAIARGLGLWSLAAPRILIIGSDRLAMQTAERLRTHYGSRDVVVGMVHLGQEPPPEAPPAPLLSSQDELDELLSAGTDELDEIWIASSHLPAQEREALIAKLQATCLTVRYVPDLFLLNLLAHVPAEVAGITVVELNASPLSGTNALLKSALDRLGAALLLLLLAPFLLLVALAIRLDSPGPVLFRQRRHGGRGNIIEVFKFRTMQHAPEAGYRQATRDDPRVTRLGRLLRRTSIDELPQLLNVLRGDMSLVGPRPHPIELNLAFSGKIEAYMQRHRVKPGITGWAQVHGYRGETDTLEKMARRVEYDLYYIENWSLWLDLRILLMTAFGAWTGRNAY